MAGVASRGASQVRPRLIRQVAWTTAAALLFNTEENFRLGRPQVALYCLVGVILVVAGTRLARRRRYAHLTAHGILTIGWLVVLGAALDGPGFYHGGLPYIMVLGSAGAAMLGMRAGLAWSGISVVGLLAVALVEQAGLGVHHEVDTGYLWLDFVDYSVAIFLLTLFSSYFVREATRFTSTLARRNRQLALENQQRRVAELEARSATSARTHFLATVSHEIRTPMNSILGMAGEISAGPLEREQRERLELLDRSAKSLLGLLSDLLDYSRLESGKVELELRAFSLPALVEEVVRLNRPLALGRVELRVDTQSLQHPVVIGDELRVRQIVQNLISNALKFTQQGRIEVQLSSAAQDQVTIAVIDTGPGIPPDRLAHLGEPFEQADASVARRHGGTGLGLAIVKRLCEVLGGRLEIESVVGQGSTFRARLQLPRGELTAVERPTTSPQLVEGLRVLVCEDNVVNQRVILEQLRRLSVSCEIVDNGRSAVNRAREEQYALLLLDYQLPDIDGPEVAKAIRTAERPAGRHLPIIGLSANAMADDRQTALAAGMDDYLTKPVSIETLRQTLSRWTEGRENRVG